MRGVGGGAWSRAISARVLAAAPGAACAGAARPINEHISSRVRQAPLCRACAVPEPDGFSNCLILDSTNKNNNNFSQINL